MERKWWTLVVVGAATFMLLLDVTIVTVALPEIQRGLHASFSDVQWVVDAYALTLASVLLTAGSLADRYGRRLFFTIGLVIFTLGSLLCGFAQSPLMLTLSRMAQGVGGAILFSTSLALLAHSFRGKGMRRCLWRVGCDHRRGRGAWPNPGRRDHERHQLARHLLGQHSYWHHRDSDHALAGRRVQDPRRLTPGLGRFHTPHAWPGIARLRPDSRERTGLGAMSACGCALGSRLPLLVAFIVTEKRVAHPMFDLSLFKIPTFSGGLAVAFAMNGSLFAMLVYLVLYLQYALGYSALGTGARPLVLSAGTLVSATIAGRLSSHMPVRCGSSVLGTHVGRHWSCFSWGGSPGQPRGPTSSPGFVDRWLWVRGWVNPPLASDGGGRGAPGTFGHGLGREYDVPPDWDRGGYRDLRDDLHLDAHQRTALLARTSASVGRRHEPARAQREGGIRLAGSSGGGTTLGPRHRLWGDFARALPTPLNDLFIVSGILALAGRPCARFDLHTSQGLLVAQGAPSQATAVHV